MKTNCDMCFKKDRDLHILVMTELNSGYVSLCVDCYENLSHSIINNLKNNPLID